MATLVDTGSDLPNVMPKRIKGWRIIDRLGEGGMGEVFLGKDVPSNSLVAIKCLKPELVGDATVWRRFLLEANVASRINHPGVVKFIQSGELDSDETDGYPESDQRRSRRRHRGP